MNKRGQGLSTNAIVLIILGVVILVALIAGFTLGWKNFAPFLSTNNVNSIVISCEVACNTQSIYDFCTQERNLQGDKSDEPLSDVTCFALANNTDYEKYGIKKCPTIPCPTP